VEGLVAVSRRVPDESFWRDRRVLLTGHTGFKGAWLALWLQRMGATVTGVSLPPETQPSLFHLANIERVTDSYFCDITDDAALETIVQRARPEVVLHLAAQALVRRSYEQPLATFASNVMGTGVVLDVVRRVGTAKVAVMITTDKVYANLEQPYPYREADVLGGHDPYSASKAAAEIVIASYRNSFFAERSVAVASARAGNVIGGGDWAQDRIIPDAIRAWSVGKPLYVRRPSAIRPWQHVIEPLAGYLVLAETLWQRPDLAGPYNFGPHTHEAATVREVVEIARRVFGKAEVSWGDGSEGAHEAGWLTLETAKARAALSVVPRWGLVTAVEKAIVWYRRSADGADPRALCVADIDDYMSAQ
jgi:CDP-glucose 4,6-dehydratase